MMKQSELLRLTTIHVDGLFGTYDHHISLNLEERITLLHAANGVGKTSVLQMTNAILQNNLSYFNRIPFARFSLAFTDTTVIELLPSQDRDRKKGTHELLLKRAGNRSKSHRLTLDPSPAVLIAARYPYLRPHEEIHEVWIDNRDGEIMTASDVIDRYGTPMDIGRRGIEVPDWFRDFLAHANAHFIGAQRLTSPSHSPPIRPPHLRPQHAAPGVAERSRDFKRRLDENMAEYGRQSQILDQSFPQRLISDETQQFDREDLLRQLTRLEQKTGEFKNIGILDVTPSFPIEKNTLGDGDDPTQAKVMELYVRDTGQKLSALDDLATRASAFLQIINKKFRNKQVQLDRKSGFMAVSDDGSRLRLDLLSSGEQHELLLTYDLLFRVPSNTVLLIDEPELSLHIAWQKEFLPDLLDIVSIAGFDALVATHSPFIVGDHSELMVALGDDANGR